MKPLTINVLLGFDFGMKRIGVAIGQMVTHTARPLATLNAVNGVPQSGILIKLVRKWGPDAFVVGIPLNMDGTEQAITINARQFAQNLRDEFSVPVYEMDERLSTKDARARLFAQGGYKALQSGQVDQVAAALILQNWFDEVK